jgi:hypothetical protein
MAKLKQCDWIGGLVSMPNYVVGEGEPFRPEALFWISVEGRVLGTSLGKPGEVLEMANDSLRETMRRPMWGRPHIPARVRVASPELAAALRAEHRKIEIVLAPTPELDAVVAALSEHLEGDADLQQSYLTPEVGPEAVASFFRAAAGLFRAQPWKVVPSDQDLFSITIEGLGLFDAAVSVVGQMGKSHGFVVFSGLHDFEAYLDAVEAIERGEAPTFPPHFTLNFDGGADLAPTLRKEISTFQWEVAGPNAFPWLAPVDEDLATRPPTAREFAIAEAIALAMPKAFSRKKRVWRAAWEGGAAFCRTVRVTTHVGELDVVLRAPYEQVIERPDGDLLAALYDLARDGDELDFDALESLQQSLVERFAESPEGKRLREVGYSSMVLDCAASYFGSTAATLGPRELKELLFEIVPRKVSIGAEAATEIVEECRAFYAFLQREFALEQAEACQRVLAGDAAERLAAELSDPSNFGMAKSLFMGGQQAGFDMESKEGIEAWMSSIQGKPMPPPMQMSGFPDLPPPAARARTTDKAALQKTKNQRKAARKARKRNR